MNPKRQANSTVHQDIQSFEHLSRIIQKDLKSQGRNPSLSQLSQQAYKSMQQIASSYGNESHFQSIVNKTPNLNQY